MANPPTYSHGHLTLDAQGVFLVNPDGSFQNGGSGASAKGYSQITSLSAAAGIGTIPTGATLALIQVEGQAVRWRDDGTNPTTTVGMQMSPGDLLKYDASDLTKIKFIEVAASAKLNVTFY